MTIGRSGNKSVLMHVMHVMFGNRQSKPGWSCLDLTPAGRGDWFPGS